MQLLRMKRQEKLDLIKLARYLELKSGMQGRKHYSKNAGRYRSEVIMDLPGSCYLLDSRYKWLRDGVLFYSRGWGWRVRKDWREVVKQIDIEELP
jgi:hypothetical protein